MRIACGDGDFDRLRRLLFRKRRKEEERSDDNQNDDDGEDEDMNVDEEDDKPAKPQLPPPETGTTLFVRNVPFEATEDELRTVYGFFNIIAFFSFTQF